MLTPDREDLLREAAERLRGLPEWEHDAIHAMLTELKDERGLNPKNAFQPIRAAVTGVLVSPPLFESMELLGRDRSIERILAGADRARAGGAEEPQTEG
jgi:glutamyl-tRNA synthetase